jgi:diaminopimelate epimerase
MLINFVKMQALGNDFVVLDGTQTPLSLNSNQIRHLAHRQLGIGCDQVLLLEPPHHTPFDFFYRIFNADGTEVAQCGNGARAVALFAHQQRLTTKKQLALETTAGILTVTVMSDTEASVALGVPQWQPHAIPLNVVTQQSHYTLTLNDKPIEFCALSIGNPHAIITVMDVTTVNVEEIGKAFNQHIAFPAGVNVSFMQVVNPKSLRLRVFERGVGETFACGSAAAAATICARRLCLVNEVVTVMLPGGELTVQWRGEGTSVMLTGPANYVFQGSIVL